MSTRCSVDGDPIRPELLVEIVTGSASRPVAGHRIKGSAHIGHAIDEFVGRLVQARFAARRPGSPVPCQRQQGGALSAAFSTPRTREENTHE
jgi:hypothetical protein